MLRNSYEALRSFLKAFLRSFSETLRSSFESLRAGLVEASSELIEAREKVGTYVINSCSNLVWTTTTTSARFPRRYSSPFRLAGARRYSSPFRLAGARRYPSPFRLASFATPHHRFASLLSSISITNSARFARASARSKRGALKALALGYYSLLSLFFFPFSLSPPLSLFSLSFFFCLPPKAVGK